MISAEIDCGKVGDVAEQLEKDFRDIAARTHLAECVSCRNTLADKPPPAETDRENILTLVINIRDGIACAG